MKACLILAAALFCVAPSLAQIQASPTIESEENLSTQNVDTHQYEQRNSASDMTQSSAASRVSPFVKNAREMFAFTSMLFSFTMMIAAAFM